MSTILEEISPAQISLLVLAAGPGPGGMRHLQRWLKKSLDTVQEVLAREERTRRSVINT